MSRNESYFIPIFPELFLPQMTESFQPDDEFLKLLHAKVSEHIAQEEFGVSELADALNMSRSTLLRKVKKATNLSVSQLISQARLQQGMQLLRTTSMNVSEVSYQVGFNSTSYFIKCFREFYGYPPGEVGKRESEKPAADPAPIPARSSYRWLWVLLFIGIPALVWWYFPHPASFGGKIPEKSIVVLPFKNNSADSSNLYLINGLIEATLNNLQQIKDLKVISRTSSEKYGGNSLTIPQMARELNATYFVEGSGQKIGNQIVLNIQLIEGLSDQHLWGKQYRREVTDIFALQQEISKDIAGEIQAVITPEEKNRIEKIPTRDLEAYDSFLKGVDLMNKGGDTNLLLAVTYFQEALERDGSFALAYAGAAMAWYYLDLFKSEKQYIDELGSYADKAMLYDPKLSESFTVKAMYYLLKKEYEEAVPYLEKGLEYNPNSTKLIELTADIYGLYLPNTAKYIEYALRGLRLDTGKGDSVTISYTYLRLGNALIQAGFVDESLDYLDKSLMLYPANAFSNYVRAFVLYAKNKDLSQTRDLLLAEFRKDSSRFDILQDLGKVSYYLRDYDTAYFYYQEFNRYREMQKLDVYRHENMIIGHTYEKVGQTQKGKEFIENYRQYLDSDQTAYKELGLAMYYFHRGEVSRAMTHFRSFAQEDNIQYWIILFLQDDPMVDHVKDLPEFKQIMAEIDTKFWRTHQKILEELEEKGIRP